MSPAKARLLQGESMPVVIDSRYFFGEACTNTPGKVSRLPRGALLDG